MMSKERQRAELHNLIVARHQEVRTAIEAIVADLDGMA